MKPHICLITSIALLAGLGLIPARLATAQTLMSLHSFDYSDGNFPEAGLILSGNTLYGTTVFGGSSSYGTVFAVNTDGTGFTNLYNFTGGNDGALPYGKLLLSGSTLYGTTSAGGENGSGTLFKVNTDGSNFTILHIFTEANQNPNSDGASPFGDLILSGNILYGTANSGGSFAYGTVFAINTDGTGFTNLYNFTGGSDGGYPWGGLILSGNTLYGVANSGGGNYAGTVFAVNTDGTAFSLLHTFTGNDGQNPRGDLILSGNNLYGMTEDIGTVFAVNTNGTGFTNLCSIGSGKGVSSPSLILSGSTLYGTAYSGGFGDAGAVFAINTDGTGFTNLVDFGFGHDGAQPAAGLILSGTTFYGTATSGGSSGWGTVFSLSYPSPQLSIMPSGTNVNVTWPSGVAGFVYSGYTLQSSTNLSPAVWSTNLSAPVVVNGQSVVTNSISGTQQFFRLLHP